MKRISLLIGIFALVALITSFGFQSNDWVPFKTKSCTILFPKQPQPQSQTMNTAIGKLNLDIYSYEPPENENDDNHVYMLMESEYPDSLINSNKTELLEGFFRKSIDGAVNNVHGKLLTETIIKYENYPGREIRVDFREGLAVIKVRFYLVKNKLYMIQTITDTKKDFNKSIAKFMDSFKLIN